MSKKTKVPVPKKSVQRRRKQNSKALVPMAVSAFAELVGVTPRAVRKAIQSGRLDRSIVLVKGKSKIANIDLARAEWNANTRGKSDAPNVGGDVSPADVHDVRCDGDDYSGLSFNEARRLREIETWLIMKAKRQGEELTLAERSGDVIPIDEARQTVLDEYMSVKTKLLGLSTRAKQRMPHLKSSDIRELDNLVREALEALSNGE